MAARGWYSNDRLLLLDSLGYPVLDANIEEPLPQVVIWGYTAYLLEGNQYREVTMRILTETT